MIHAACVLLTTPIGSALFLKRADAGLWAFPCGHIEEGETPETAAARECLEETGFRIGAPDRLLMRRIDGDVECTAFQKDIDEEFTPKLNGEHVGYAWTPIAAPPEPLHPGCAAALAMLTADELGIARLMAAGDLVSPWKYANVALVALRITGTGMAYRRGLDEYAWRDADIYLTDEFLARCNGLPVIMEHPEGSMLNDQEFINRIVGTIFLPYIKGNEVWGIAKIYDAALMEYLEKQPLSTSPAVVFGDPEVNSKIPLEDGSHLLIEGKPSLLDHVAICERGVWDKGGDPMGIDAAQEPQLEEDDEIAAKQAMIRDRKLERADSDRKMRIIQNLMLLDVQMSNYLSRKQAP
jgi:8-oxo-dGTP pyrophosphatase MutT (NUDIX family)